MGRRGSSSSSSSSAHLADELCQGHGFGVGGQPELRLAARHAAGHGRLGPGGGEQALVGGVLVEEGAAGGGVGAWQGGRRGGGAHLRPS